MLMLMLMLIITPESYTRRSVPSSLCRSFLSWDFPKVHCWSQIKSRVEQASLEGVSKSRVEQASLEGVSLFTQSWQNLSAATSATTRGKIQFQKIWKIYFAILFKIHFLKNTLWEDHCFYKFHKNLSTAISATTRGSFQHSFPKPGGLKAAFL